MNSTIRQKQFNENRNFITDQVTEPGNFIKKFSSVEIKGAGFFFQCRIRNIKHSGISILLNLDSIMLKHLKQGDVLNMKYYLNNISEVSQKSYKTKINLSSGSGFYKTEIKNISKVEKGRFDNHFLVNLSIMDDGHIYDFNKYKM